METTLPTKALLVVVALVAGLQAVQKVEAEQVVQGRSEERGDLHSSISDLENLQSLEGEVVRLLEEYLRHTEESTHVIRRYVTEHSGTSGAQVEHPIDAFVLLRRLTVQWQRVEDSLKALANRTQDVVSRVGSWRGGTGTTLPSMHDLHGAAVSLVRLRTTYDLAMTTLPAGTFTFPFHGVPASLHEYRSTRGLNARDCLFLGKHALSTGEQKEASQWFQAALDRAQGPDDATVTTDEVMPLLMAARMDILGRDGAQEGDKAKGTEDSHPEPHPPKAAFTPTLHLAQTEEEQEDHYRRLCRGERLRPLSMEAGLRCRLVTPSPGMFTLQPLRVEEASLAPYIVIIHQFITAAQTQAIIDKAKPRLATSRHRGRDGGFVSSMVRTSKNAWLREAEEPDQLMTRLTKRIEAATHLHALNSTSGEDYQVANYGLGGLYVTHTDYMMVDRDPGLYTAWENHIGDRYTTFMIYLSDVAAGGATVFPRAGVTVWPERGAAVMWWNLFRDGQGDEDTRHGACPVLHGSKWICNKWIHYNDQFLRHPCGLREDERVMYP